MTDERVGRMIVTLRVVWAAIVLGLLSFTAVAVALVTGGTFSTQPRLAPLLLSILGLSAAAMIVVFQVVRQTLLAGLRRARRSDPATEVPLEKLVNGFQAMTIVGGALAEAPGLFGTVVFLLTGHWLALLVPLVSCGVLGLLFPSRDRFTRFAVQVTGVSEL